MGFQSQEPVFVQRARQVASLHMAYQLKYGRPSKGFWAFGAQPQPLSVQAPGVWEGREHGEGVKLVAVTLRYPERWQVRVCLRCTTDGHECWQWKVVYVDSSFPSDIPGKESEMVESRTEGQRLYTTLVASYCLRMDDLACTYITSTAENVETTADGGQIVTHEYRMANGETVEHREFFDLVDGILKHRIPMPAHLFVSPIYEAA